MNTPVSINQTGTTAWRALTYFNFYRFLIAFLFVALFWIGQLPEPLGVYDRTLFSLSTHIYLSVAVAAQFFIRLRTPPYPYQVMAQVLADIVIVSLMMYASAGLNSGFGMLLVITVAGGGLLIPGKIGVLFAALATIAVLGQEVYVQLYRLFPPPNYTHAGFLGITFFITAFISKTLASRVQESEALAEQRAVDLEKLAKLNEHIVQRLQSGIIVLDDALNVLLLNESAKKLLNIGEDEYHLSIDRIAPELVDNAREWLRGSGEKTIVFRHVKGGVDIQTSFVSLNLEHRFELLLFLDDVSVLRQRAQQMKLASLGRLTASIAHEVRNPLGAISHAGQLLSESKSLDQEDKRLTAIIEEHSQRVNNIIENIMSISRRQQSEPVSIELHKWLNDFIAEFATDHGLLADSISLSCDPDKVLARMDPVQLHQVLWNLLENGIRYSQGRPLLELMCAIRDETLRPYIDIIDHGSGLSSRVEEHLFEPFFTTEANGTGLGLYIARELCEANQATLSLQKNTKDGCCFRINFSHPEKQHVLV